MFYLDRPNAEQKLIVMSPNQMLGPSSESVKDGKMVIILSHDLDNYSMMPLVLRRDFHIKSMRAHFLTFDESPDKPVYVGLHFAEFMGRKVDGYFMSVSSVIASGILATDDVSKIEGMTVVQLVPEFEGYRGMNRVLGGLLNNPELKGRSVMPNEGLAQQLAEDTLLNVIGLCMAMPALRNNPIPGSVTDIQLKVRKSALINEPDAIWKFFAAMKISYSMHKIMDGFFGLGRAKNKFLETVN
jgi:hypothetical protein